MREPGARCSMLIRCWQVLRELEGGRVGKTLDELAQLTGVSTRTIRRDLEALQAAGFPLVDDYVHDGTGENGHGVRRWRAYDWRKEVA